MKHNSLTKNSEYDKILSNKVEGKMKIMKYCPRCGQPSNDINNVCSSCGFVFFNQNQSYGGQQYANQPVYNPNMYRPMDAPNVGFGVLGFFFPLIGLILYLCWKDQTPLKAKSAGKGALIGFISSVVISIITVIVLVSVGSLALFDEFYDFYY